VLQNISLHILAEDPAMTALILSVYMVNVRSPDQHDKLLAMAQSLQTRFTHRLLGMTRLLRPDIV